MAYFLFIDESGQDRKESPYEVLAGVAVKDQDLWNLIQALRDAELRHFGVRYTADRGELRAKKLLKAKTFRLAAQLPPIEPGERSALAARCLANGAAVSRRELTALAQAKIAYVSEALEICARFRCRAFASLIPPDAPRPAGSGFLRKDYAYLFERFFYFLEDSDREALGLVVFDELERVQSHLLIEQMNRYFQETWKGRTRASQIIPEPFFVHSELTTGVQIADLVAYILSWGFRLPGMDEPARPELADLVDRVCQIRYRATRERMGNPNFVIWSFALIADLRAREEAGG
ncbi:DUF3800 domain-containing protein [Longimicrobium sp.]|uniref:DUF3800 domain-containing protein n=1 Tax=Longimicrobium sp. TaxID=2029185 RepID=UPI002E340238|nr:DUF3800 domain-containing protein [Longimicrobium sp.]HEX6041692.1 DUF3800 domain-containing protein [Longimicrobium sp.]